MRRGILAAATAALAMLVGTLAVTFAPAPAGAHAFLTGSDPGDGATLKAAPRTMRLDFSESVVLEATHVEIVDSRGRQFAPTSIRMVGPASADTEDPSHVQVGLPPLPRAAYRVSWQTLSSDDLHSTSGVLVFGVGTAVRAAPFAEPAPRAEEATVRWLIFVGLALALGAALAGRLYRRSGAWPDDRERVRIRRLGTAGALLAAAAAVGLLVDQVAQSGSDLQTVLTSRYGAHWALREAGLVVLAVGLLPRLGSGRRFAALVGTGVAAACLGAALLGHSATGGATLTLADAIHLAAAAAWSGVLIVAGAALVGRRRAGVPIGLTGMLQAFRAPALACTGALVVTGVYLASGVVGSVDAALLTTYGRTLLIKLGVVVVIAVLGLLNTRRLHARVARLPRRTVLGEGVLALVVLALAAVLTSGQPAREQRFVTQPQARVVALQTIAVADLQETLSVRPNRPGPNVVLVSVFDTRRPAPAPITAVSVQQRAADGTLSAPVAATALADGRWSAALTFAAPGSAPVVVSVQRGGEPAVRQDYSWVVAGATGATGATEGTRPATVSTAPIGATLRTLAALLAVAALALVTGWALLARRRRVPSREAPQDPAPDPGPAHRLQPTGGR